MASEPSSAPEEARVLLLPPTTRDAQAISQLLSANAVACLIFPTFPALCEAIEVGAGAVVISEEALIADSEGLIRCVGDQPVWSDLPIIVLARSGIESPKLAAALPLLGNISVLERPVRITTFLSLVRSALRGRERQYQVRAQLVRQEQAEEALRSGEERLRLAVETGRLGIWELDLRTEEMTCSPTCKSTFGRAPDSPFTYRNLWESIHPDDVDRVRSAVRDSVSRQVEYDIEYRNIWPDQTIHWVLARGRPALSRDRQSMRLVGVTLDITERKSIEERRAALLEAERSARHEAERAGRMKDEFLATLSHELRTPLNAILGWAQILKSNASDPADVADGISIIERNARAQTQIIEDLLDMSRMISGKIRLNVQRMDLTAVIQASIETVRPAAEAKGVRLEVVLDEIGKPISGDPNRLQQVFWNLLTNAVKFTPRDGRIQVVLERVESHLQMRVSDTGEGIEPAFLPFVFDRFRQADAATTRRHGGLGLGLAIVRQLVELHGGSIRVNSPGPGKGATFIVSLPMTVMHLDDEPEAEPKSPHAANAIAISQESCAKIKGVRVLIVDDESDARLLVKRFLEDCEAKVLTASSAQQAIDLLIGCHPDVLVSDIGMPNEDGYSLIRRIRSLPPDGGGAIPAIALTAYARPQDRVNAIVAGFQHHITKPVEPAELIAMIASLTGNREQKSLDPALFSPMAAGLGTRSE